jgi:hypothetical protein
MLVARQECSMSQKDSSFYVEIVELATNKIEKRMGPMPELKAERVMAGVDINLDSTRFVSRVVRSAQPAKRSAKVGVATRPKPDVRSTKGKSEPRWLSGAQQAKGRTRHG